MNWKDDWKITHLDTPQRWTNVDISIPHAHGKAKRVHFNAISDARVMWLIDLLDCALHEYSQSKE